MKIEINPFCVYSTLKSISRDFVKNISFLEITYNNFCVQLYKLQGFHNDDIVKEKKIIFSR